MTEDMTGSEAPFDLERVQALMELMEKHGLTEIHLRRGDEQWRLRRGGAEVVQAIAAYPSYPGMPAYPPQGSPTAPQTAAPAAPAEAGKEAGLMEIKSPTVGTFYPSPTPDDPPFVTVGSKVKPDTVVCLVEAMKVFNQIPAEVSGTIVEVLVQNGDSVEFGQPMFRVRPE